MYFRELALYYCLMITFLALKYALSEINIAPPAFLIRLVLHLFLHPLTFKLCTFMGFPGGSDSKEFTCNVADLGSIPGLGRSPGGGHGNPLQYSCLENPQGWGNLAGYSPWGLRDSDTTE